MPWFKKKADPISDRARVLNDQIASLEAEIKKLSVQVETGTSAPKPGSTLPSASGASAPSTRSGLGAPVSGDPIFEAVDHSLLDGSAESATTKAHFNELGLRKYDLPALWRRLRNHFRGPATTNPKLVNYLAAGGIQGLRPLRYEKRVARNRFLFLVIMLFLMVLGLIWFFVKNGR